MTEERKCIREDAYYFLLKCPTSGLVETLNIYVLWITEGHFLTGVMQKISPDPSYPANFVSLNTFVSNRRAHGVQRPRILAFLMA